MKTQTFGEKILIPYLLNRRIKHIDYVICSHFDTDHVGGIKSVLENLNVTNLVISKQKEEYDNYKEIMEIALKKRVNLLVVSSGDKIQFDKTSYIDVLYPEKVLKLDDINNNSIVGKFVCKNVNILFTR